MSWSRKKKHIRHCRWMIVDLKHEILNLNLHCANEGYTPPRVESLRAKALQIKRLERRLRLLKF